MQNPLLLKALRKFTSVDIQPFIMEVHKAELEAQLVAESIAQQLEKRVSFRRAMKKSLRSTMRVQRPKKFVFLVLVVWVALKWLERVA